MVEMLLHENAHVKLRQIQVLDSLLEDQWDGNMRFAVPWRPDSFWPDPADLLRVCSSFPTSQNMNCVNGSTERIMFTNCDKEFPIFGMLRS